MITPTQIRAAILASAELRSLVESGSDSLAASQILIATPSGFRLTRVGVLNLLGPINGALAIHKLRTLAADDSDLKTANVTTWIVLRELLGSLLDPAGVDISHPDAASMFSMLITLEVVTTEQAAIIASKAVAHETPSVEQLTQAVAVWRPNGVVAAIPQDAQP